MDPSKETKGVKKKAGHDMLAAGPKAAAAKAGGAKAGKGKAGASKAGAAKGAAASQPAERAPLATRGLFSKDLKSMMYGFGDAEEPYPETIDLVEDLVVDYVTSLIQATMDHATGKGNKPSVADLLFLLRKDSPKYARAQKLLQADKEIKAAKRLADDDEIMKE